MRQIFTDFAVQSHRIASLNMGARAPRTLARVKAAKMVRLLPE
jgi:hypothetical protein